MNRLKIILQSKYTYYLLIFISIINIVFFTNVIKYKSKYDNEYLSIEGIILSIKKNDGYYSLIIKTPEKIKANYVIQNLDLEVGQKVLVSGIIKDVNNNTIPNTFNYKKYLYYQHIYKIMDVSNIKKTADENIINKIRNIIINKQHNNNLINKYIKLFIFGDKTQLTKADYNVFKDNGIAHLIAVSGMHVSFLILILEKLMFKFRNTIKNIIIFLIILFYSFLLSFSSSILRCFIMWILKCINKKLNLNIDNNYLLIFTFFMFIIINPFYFYNVGFRYSFIISFGLIYSNKYTKCNYVQNLIKLSIISFLFSLPITTGINFEINITSIIINILMIPLVTYLIFPFIILSFIVPVIGNNLSFLIELFEKINLFFNNYSIFINIPKMSWIVVLMYYAIIIFYIKYKNNKYIFLGISIILINYLIPKFDNNYHVLYLDVGQGDAALLIAPHKKEVILVDTGGNYYNKYVSQNIILYLKSVGITYINYLILSHGDFDHIGEAINLVENIKINNVIFNCDNYNDLEIDLIKVLTKKNVKYYSDIKSLNFNNNLLYFLDTGIYNNENDNSSVLYFNLNHYQFLFMGDASIKRENDILEKYNLRDIDILKVGHHGSNTSSSKEFINIINPKYSIISVGKNNRYGHPKSSVLDILKNSKIYRTDKNGSIMFNIKKNKLEIETYLP